MMTSRYLMLTLVFICLVSCSTKSVTNKEIDKFISQYNNDDFDNLNDIFIFQRSRDLTEIVYGVGKFEGNKPLYFVTFNLLRQKIVEINRTILEKDSIADYFTENQIANAVRIIRKYDFYLLGIDSSNNAYINPYFADGPAYFLRLKYATGDSIIRKGYTFSLYRDNWYLNKDN